MIGTFAHQLKRNEMMQMTMRAVVFMIVGSILSILAFKYSQNDLNAAVPMIDPAAAVAQPT